MRVPSVTSRTRRIENRIITGGQCEPDDGNHKEKDEKYHSGDGQFVLLEKTPEFLKTRPLGRQRFIQLEILSIYVCMGAYFHHNRILGSTIR